MTDFYLPRSLDHLWAALAAAPEAEVYAGGTDLLVRVRREAVRPGALICLERIDKLRVIEDRPEAIFIGAGVTHRRLLDSPVIRRHCPVLAQAVAQLGSPQIRNMGTIGGNVATASPAGDTLPPLVVMGAEVELRHAGGTRHLPLTDFIKGPGRTDLGAGEIVSGVRIPKKPHYTLHHFEKVGRRSALAIAVVSLAACIQPSERGDVKQARLAWGSVGPTVMTVPGAEACLAGRPLGPASLAAAAEAARRALDPIDDVRATADYRRRVAGNLLLRLADCGEEKRRRSGVEMNS